MSTTNLTSPVQDMTCASCVAHVERALQSVDGVDELNVKLDVRSRTETVVLAVQWGWVGTA
ncbi:MAG: hypothetical protein GTN71_12110 [Anaerolineae bacterium]|nr:hypothetical protein [Anaerolineae bacterium]